jgi:phage terminase small subunit
MSDQSELSPRQQRFVQEYLVDLNGSAAVVRAGYAQSGCASQARRLLGNAQIAAAVSAARRQVEVRTEVTQDLVLRELARLGFSDGRRLFDEQGKLRPIKEWSDADAACISSIEVTRRIVEPSKGGKPAVIDEVHKIKLWDKNAALAKVGQHLGMFVDRQQMLGADGRPVDPRMQVALIVEK